MKVEEIKIGTPVTFFQLITDGEKHYPIKTFITSKPSTDKDGDIVCSVDGVYTPVLISHLDKREIIVNKRTAKL